jgi:HPt (histidine-containing phosphotransfer) domain-containing protein
MITQDQFVQNVEKIATRLVLLDSEDTDELQQIVSMFDLLLDWSRQNLQPALEHALVLFSDFSVNHFTTNAPTRDVFIALIEEFVAVVQTHGRNDFDFSSCPFPSELTRRSQEHEPLSIDNSESTPQSPLRNLRHPGVLPSHLDMDLFAEFLALQSEVLDKMEALCLRIEQDNNPDDIAELKRMIHTKKGEAGFLNLADIESLCHVTEDLIAHPSFNDHRDVLFQMIDWIRNAYIWYKGESENPPDEVSGLIEMISGLMSIPTDPVVPDVSSVDHANDQIGRASCRERVS